MHVNHQKPLRRNIYFCIYGFGLQMRNIYVKTIFTSVTQAASQRWKFDLLNIGRCPDGHRPVPGRASADLLRDSERP